MSSLHRAFAPWGNLDEVILDAPVRALVRALNSTGWVWTVFSCAGHPEEPDSVTRGRRQAHVDVVTRDLHRWLAYSAECRRRLQDERGLVGGEGSLGAVPEWLAPHLPVTAGKGEAPWWRRLLRQGGNAEQWHYRRLVLEPKPYDAPPELVRTALDRGIAAAAQALEQ